MQIPESIRDSTSAAKADSRTGDQKDSTGWIKVLGAQENNLKNVDVEIPLGVMTCVTGVSGSEKVHW